jgi:hypothetical protein
MAQYLNLDDAEALRLRCDARAPDLFSDEREPQLQVIRIPKTTDEGGNLRFSSTEDVMSVGHLKTLSRV